MTPNHECVRGGELDNLHKQVDELSKYPAIIAEVRTSNVYVKETVDSLCTKVEDLTVVVHQLAVTQAGTQEILKQLATTKQEVTKELVDCSTQCAQHRAQAGSRMGGLETLVHGKEGAPGLISRVEYLETAIKILKWFVMIVTGAAATAVVAVAVKILFS